MPLTSRGSGARFLVHFRIAALTFRRYVFAPVLAASSGRGALAGAARFAQDTAQQLRLAAAAARGVARIARLSAPVLSLAARIDALRGPLARGLASGTQVQSLERELTAVGIAAARLA